MREVRSFSRACEEPTYHSGALLKRIAEQEGCPVGSASPGRVDARRNGTLVARRYVAATQPRGDRARGHALRAARSNRRWRALGVPWNVVDATLQPVGRAVDRRRVDVPPVDPNRGGPENRLVAASRVALDQNELHLDVVFHVLRRDGGPRRGRARARRWAAIEENTSRIRGLNTALPPSRSTVASSAVGTHHAEELLAIERLLELGQLREPAVSRGGDDHDRERGQAR